MSVERLQEAESARKLEAFKKFNEEQRTKGVPKSIEGSNLRPIKLKTKWVPPEMFTETSQVREMLAEVKAQKASEIFIMPGEPIAIMVEGELFAITYRVMKLNEAQVLLEIITHTTAAIAKISGGESLNGTTELFEKSEEGENVKTVRGLKKYNRYRHNASPCMTPLGNHFQITMRHIPDDPLKYDELGMTEDDVESFIYSEGIIIIAGRTGSGKTTTLAAAIRYILEGDTIIKGNIVTHEEPIEFRYDNILSRHSVVAQSEIGEHFADFNKANREAMRRFPALILLGELRDSETIQAAVEASQTGHPVFATTHATNVQSIIPRMVSRFPDERKNAAAYDIIESARLFVAQKLIKNIKTGKRFAVRETLVLSPELRQILLDIISTESEIAMIKEIRRIMANEEYGAKNFKSQADVFLAEGIIDSKGYKELVS